MEVDRQRLRSLKGVKWSKYGPDVIPAWVADMDFSPSPRILSEIQKMVDLGDFGYRYHDVDLLIPAWCEWVEESHGWLPPVEECRVFTSSMNALEVVMLLKLKNNVYKVHFGMVYCKRVLLKELLRNQKIENYVNHSQLTRCHLNLSLKSWEYVLYLH